MDGTHLGEHVGSFARAWSVMTVVNSLWASIQGDPKFMRAVNGWFTVFWLAMIPVSLLTGWISSVAYVAALSLWALVSGHWSAWQAARVEVRQQEDFERAEQNPVEERVVETLVEKTSLEPADGSADTTPPMGISMPRSVKPDSQR